MPYFALYCLDKAGSAELRQSVRPTHVQYLESKLDIIRIGGPLLTAEGQACGSLLVVEVEDEAAARAFSKGDPYAQAGLFESVQVRPWRLVFGGFK